ncbi:PAS domain S-box protein, partial [Thermodesulfobacteriota bacterium]
MLEKLKLDEYRQRASEHKPEIVGIGQKREMLHDVEATCSILVAHAQDGIAIVQDDAFQFVNPAMESISGYSVEELKQMKLMNIIASEDKKGSVEQYGSRISDQPIPAYYRSKFKRKDGAFCDVEVSDARIQYRGRPAAMSIVRNITARKQVEEALRKSEKKSPSFFEKLTDIVYRANSVGIVTYA